MSQRLAPTSHFPLITSFITSEALVIILDVDCTLVPISSNVCLTVVNGFRILEAILEKSILLIIDVAQFIALMAISTILEIVGANVSFNSFVFTLRALNN